MDARIIKTYSRKRKRSASTVSVEQAEAPSTRTENTRSSIDAASRDIDKAAACTLPSPPPSSSPLQQHQLLSRALQPLSQNLVEERILSSQVPTNSDHSSRKISKSSETDQPGPSRPVKKKSRKFTQLTLDLGGAGAKQTRCSSCGMAYVPCNEEDAKLHREFHAASLAGVGVPGGVPERWRIVRRCARKGGAKRGIGMKRGSKTKRDGEGTDLVVEVGVQDTLSVRNLAKRVLDVAEQEMGAIGVAAGLWRMTGSGKADSRAKESLESVASNIGHDPTKHGKHKIYLYVQDGACIGLCLADRITSAFRVEANKSSRRDSSSISSSPYKVPAALGVSRIWVSREFRSRGIATELLEVMRQEFIYGIEVHKDDVAFSQPTESGGKLANAWFGRENGWLVYDGSH